MTTPKQLPDSLIVRVLKKSDNLSKLSFGDPDHTPLKIFLKKSALVFQDNNVAITYVLVDNANPARVWGYISLMCSNISLEDGDKPTENESFLRYDYFPAIKLARLAIDGDLQGKNYGSGLVEYALEIIIKNIMPNVGCRFMTVDSKKGSIGFYEKLGFRLIERNPSFLENIINKKLIDSLNKAPNGKFLLRIFDCMLKPIFIILKKMRALKEQQDHHLMFLDLQTIKDLQETTEKSNSEITVAKHVLESTT